MIFENDPTQSEYFSHSVVIHYPDYLDSNEFFKSEVEFRSRAIHRKEVIIGNGKLEIPATSFSNAQFIQSDIAPVVKRFIRRKP